MTENKIKKRPVFITVLCVIAFVHLGVSVLIGLLSGLISSAPRMFYDMGMHDFIIVGANMAGGWYAILSLLLAVLAIVGVIQIWNMHKRGFWLFLIPMVIFLIIPFIILTLPINYILMIMAPNLVVLPALMILFGFNLKKLD